MMQQCPNGHLYDDTKNSTCPYCNATPAPNPMASTVPVGSPEPAPMGGMDPINPTVPVGAGAGPMDFPATTPLEPVFSPTVALGENNEGILPVTGWLICLEGKKKGEAFAIRGEQTTIGRGAGNNIQLDFDAKISSGANAIIAYDRRNNKFFIYQKENRNNIYVNNSLLLVPVEIHDYDVIEMGETKMILRTLCNEKFVWDDENV